VTRPAEAWCKVYAVGCVIALAVFGAIVGVSTFFRSRIGLGLSIVIMATPAILFIVGVVRQIRW
jgi:hypothetical protein